MKRIINIIFLLFIVTPNIINAQELPIRTEIKWDGIKNEKINDSTKKSFLSFDGAVFENLNSVIPYIIIKDKNSDDNSTSAIKLSDLIFEELTTEEANLISNVFVTNTEIIQERIITYENKIPYSLFRINPFRKNTLTGKTEKLIAFNYTLKKEQLKTTLSNQQKNTYSQNSKLANGLWYKMAVKNTGIHKISYTDLLNMGINVDNLNPQNISIFGNPAGMLPESNNAKQYDDINELAILIVDGNDGKFNTNDYLLFYGQSPVIWKLNSTSGLFEHQINYYSDQTYYFLTTQPNIGTKKRISAIAGPTSPATHQINSFIDYSYHHRDLENLAKSGKIWLGEKFSSIVYNYTFPFQFQDVIKDSLVFLKYNLFANSPVASNFVINANGNVKTVAFDGFPSSASGTLALNRMNYFTFQTNSDLINIALNYDHPFSTSVGWLHSLELNLYRQLKFSGNQLAFRTTKGIGAGNITQFTISNCTQNVNVWDITDPINVYETTKTLNGTELTIKIASDSLKEFIAYNGSSYYSPEFIGLIANQNLHGFAQQDYIIVSHPLFVNEANRLAKLHTDNQMRVKVVTPEQVYNEFSSGSQDPKAIRNFMKMFYDRAIDSSQLPKYLLLFGDASYDFKNRITNNTNFVPTYQSENSFDGSSSYSSDDFFGFLDATETGVNSYESLDLGIGRFPVKSLSEAKTVVDKTLRYASQKDLLPNSNINISNFADWRNTVCFIADDEDNNEYLTASESIYNKVKNLNPTINADKIYLDAYQQISNAGGQRYPDVNTALNQRVEKGALIMNYIGHGGELGWCHERVLEISDILKWKNYYNMPLFLTATCEFSRYDDPERTSAGELVLLNPNGGGVALLTTSRLAYQAPNMVLNNGFFNRVFKKTNGIYPSLGDLIRGAKNDGVNTTTLRNFVLLGDPALKLAYPKYNVLTTHINNKVVNNIPDTIKGLSKVTIKGIVTDDYNNKINYNGVLYPTIFDKPFMVTTLANDPTSGNITFELPKAILYKGKASITKGEFEFSFVVPKDISYYYGLGKISYYAKNDTVDASGYYNKVIVGDLNSSAVTDENGPQIKLFMNDTNFVAGGITDENPVLLAKIQDVSGINTVGNGIGHDIMAYFDGNDSKPFILNDYYVSDLDIFNKGSVYYPFFDLSDGPHYVRVKVWDVYNNSAEGTTHFIVAKSAQMVINNLLNYPNPFFTSTNFVFEHNQSDTELKIEIQIFDINGKNIKTIQTNIMSGGYKIDPIVWDGKTDSGQQIGKGMYIYRVIVSKPNGEQVIKSDKLVFLR